MSLKIRLMFIWITWILIVIESSIAFLFDLKNTKTSIINSLMLALEATSFLLC